MPPQGTAILDGRRPWAALRRHERAENFPVALRILPRERRALLRAVYGVVRWIDELGDAANGNRTDALLDFDADLERLWTGQRPESVVLARLAGTPGGRALPRAAFHDLVRANLQDQAVRRYETFADVLAYCRLSAAPIGRIVLAVFDAETERQVALSDQVCAGLQLLEHWQDVAEDRRAGRVYLPGEDLRAFGVRESDLDAEVASPRLRRLITWETERAEGLIGAADELLPLLTGWARVAVAGYVAGGRAAAESLRRCGGDVLAVQARPRPTDVVRAGWQAWTGAWA